MNVGNELAQIKNCKDFDEINKFLEDHNLKFDHWYFKGDISDFTDNKIYVVAYYRDIDGVFVHITFNF